MGAIGNHISAVLMQEAFDYLDAPVINCTGKDVPMPYASNLEKHLLGFTNTLNTKEKTLLTTSFRDHLESGQTIERAGYNEFFTEEEYKIADHHIQGEMSSEGVFEGTISVFQGKKQKVKNESFYKS